MMWQFFNPVQVMFGHDSLENIQQALQGRRYALVTYDSPYFASLANAVAQQNSGCQVVLNQVFENPDLHDLSSICEAFLPHSESVEVLVALGGGSVIDTTKALAVAQGSVDKVKAAIQANSHVENVLPIIAIPTTTGTGSEVTCWATIWDKASNTKYSLNHLSLYPETAICDPKLTEFLPIELTVQTGLDALSHALESLWNKNRNPVSAHYAHQAILSILEVLPKLVAEPTDLELRSKMMMASLWAGLAFSNTKTSISHNISYAVTLDKGLAHGIACSFTLPAVLASYHDCQSDVAQDLRQLFGQDLNMASHQLTTWFHGLGVKTSPQEYGYNNEQWTALVTNALQGERGQNFSGDPEALIQTFKKGIPDYV